MGQLELPIRLPGQDPMNPGLKHMPLACGKAMNQTGFCREHPLDTQGVTTFA